MEFDKLSNRVIAGILIQCHRGGCSKQDRLLHPPSLKARSSASSSSFVLFVSFVVKQICIFARALSPCLFLLIHSKRQRAKKRPLSL